MRRVAITGLGAISALGIGVPALWAGLVSGRSGVRRITRFDPSAHLAQVAAEVPEFNPAAYFDDSLLALLDPFAQYALVAADEACRDAGLELSEDDRDRAGVAIASAMGGVSTQDKGYRQIYGEGATRVHPFSIPRMMNNAAAAHVSMRHRLRGPTLSFATACSAAAHAIGEAAEIIRAGRADVMVAGGTDAPIVPGVVRAWESMRVMAPAAADPARTCRPFSRDRLGLVLGEGAGVVVLESWERATALAQAGLEPSDVDYVNAHGTATLLNDATETAVLKLAFGAHAPRLAISSTKAVHGHAMGASAALEFIAAVLATREGVVPPTANYTDPDPACDLDYVPNTARTMPVRAAISNSFAFGGLNAVLAIRAVAAG